MFKKNFLSEIPLSRALTYMMILGIIPFLLILWNYNAKRSELQRLESTLASLQYKAAFQREKLALNERVQNHFAHAESSYIDDSLHSLCLLSQERAALESIMQNRNFSGNETIEERYRLLNEEKNRVSLVETQVKSEENMHETQLTLEHPVELDTTDLKELLVRIEHPHTSNAPQLFITDFELIRKKSMGEAEVYTLQKLKLLKREFENDGK